MELSCVWVLAATGCRAARYRVGDALDERRDRTSPRRRSALLYLEKTGRKIARLARGLEDDERVRRDHESLRRTLVRGELPRLLYRLGHGEANGVLTVCARLARAEIFVLRRGAAVVGAKETGLVSGSAPLTPDTSERAKKALIARLVRLSAQDISIVFEGGVAGVLPVGPTSHVSLVGWARSHLEAQLDGSLADTIVREMAGVRIVIRGDFAPEAQDEADRRMLVAMALPRRLDQIWPLARTPRFRLLAFVHFLRSVGALDVEGVAAERSAGTQLPRLETGERVAAARLLGIDQAADLDTVKRAYRRLARALHPDLQPEADASRRRVLERRFAELTAAYEALT
jgi:DnaJ-domain-containing protein 1